LELKVDEERGEDIIGGAFTCAVCQQSYPISDGIPNLYRTATRISDETLKIAIPYLAAITAGELIVALVDPLGGVVFHILLLAVLVSHASLTARPSSRRLYLALALAPLIRLLSLSLPLISFPRIYWYAIVAVPLFVSLGIVMLRLNLRPRQVGLFPGRLRTQFLVAFTGIPFGIAEYFILSPPEPLVESSSLTSILLGALILLVATGFTEELAFRGIMQRLAGEAMGRWGWLYVAVVFAVLHIGYLLVLDVFFVLGVGLFFGWVVKRTGSLLGVTLSHGIANICLYVVIPLLV
jgi:membrane protease YdiL (CAAX protease family)